MRSRCIWRRGDRAKAGERLAEGFGEDADGPDRVVEPVEPRREADRSEVGFGQGGDQAGGEAEFVAQTLLSSQ